MVSDFLLMSQAVGQAALQYSGFPTVGKMATLAKPLGPGSSPGRSKGYWCHRQTYNRTPALHISACLPSYLFLDAEITSGAARTLPLTTWRLCQIDLTQLYVTCWCCFPTCINLHYTGGKAKLSCGPTGSHRSTLLASMVKEGP